MLETFAVAWVRELEFEPESGPSGLHAGKGSGSVASIQSSPGDLEQISRR